MCREPGSHETFPLIFPMMGLTSSHGKGVVFPLAHVEMSCTLPQTLYPQAILMCYDLQHCDPRAIKGPAACLAFCNYFVLFCPWNNLFASNRMGLFWHSGSRTRVFLRLGTNHVVDPTARLPSIAPITWKSLNWYSWHGWMNQSVDQ